VFAWLIFLIGHDFIRVNFARVKRSLARSPCLLPQEPADSSVSLSFSSGQRYAESAPFSSFFSGQRYAESAPLSSFSSGQRYAESAPQRYAESAPLSSFFSGQRYAESAPFQLCQGPCHYRYAPRSESAVLSRPISLTAHKRKGPVSTPFPRGTRQGINFNGIISLAFIPSTRKVLSLVNKYSALILVHAIRFTSRYLLPRSLFRDPLFNREVSLRFLLA